MTKDEVQKEPLEEADKSYVWLEKGMRFYMPDIFAEELYEWFIYDADRWDKRAMERGIVFQTKEEAIACAKKMLEVVKQEG